RGLEDEEGERRRQVKRVGVVGQNQRGLENHNEIEIERKL
ncbi:hypothetical protein LINPERPRIM_LOCUS24017, partial [Linum perenne]